MKTSANDSAPFFHSETVEERLRRAQFSVTLLVAAMSADDDVMPQEELMSAAYHAALELRDELIWLKNALTSTAILNLPAPTDAERIDARHPDKKGGA